MIGQSKTFLNNIPQYLISEYPLFVDFIKSYYEYMDTVGNPNDIIQNVMSYSDIDDTLESFLQYFKKDLLNDLPLSVMANERTFLKHIKELYTAKGSEASYRLLFRALYNKEITFYSPINNILRPSNGKWYQNYSICVEIPNTYSLEEIIGSVGSELQIVFNSQNLYIQTIDCKLLAENGSNYIIEFFLLQDLISISKLENIDTSISTNVSISGIFSGTLLKTLIQPTLLKGGDNFNSGTIISIDSSIGTNGKILLKNVTSGTISNVEIVNFGYGYYNTFQEIINPIGTNFARANATLTSGTITAINLINGGSGYTSAPTIQIIGDGRGAKAHCTISGGVVNSIVIDYGGIGYTYPPSIVFSDSSAVIKYNIGSVRKYPGYYTASDSLISDDSYIQDGYYYQTYSYVIDVDILFDKYKTILKKLLHPSGYKMFGAVSNFDKQNLTSTSIPISTEVSNTPFDIVFVYDSINWLFNKNDIADSVTSFDTLNGISFNKNWVDDLDFTSSEEIYVRRILGLFDSFTVPETVEKTIEKTAQSDSVTLAESVYIPPFLTVIVNDSVIPYGMNQSDAYSENFNSTYFADDYLEEPLNITFPA